MKRIVLILVSVFCMCCMVACGGEVKEDASAGGNNEVLGNSADDNPVVTEAPKPTEEPSSEVEPTEEPSFEVEPTADPVETLKTLRQEAIAEHTLIMECLQGRIALVDDILEVVKEYPNFDETAAVYTDVLWASSELEKYLLTDDINNQIVASNYLNITISNLVSEYPDLKSTEEFKKLIEAPTFEVAFYNARADIYNSALSNSATSEFEELPYCIMVGSQIEY